MGIKSTELAFTRRIGAACIVGLLAALTACGANVGVVREVDDSVSGAGTSPTAVAGTGSSTGSTVPSAVSVVTASSCSATLHCAP